MSAVVGDVAGEVLGPRPGKAACSFSKGIGEMILRTGAAILGVFPIITGAMTLGYNNEYLPALNEGDNETAQAQINANAAGSLSFIAGVLIVVWAVIMIILRILNIGALNIGSKYFLTIDIVVNSILAIIAFVAGILNAVFATNWEDLNGSDADAVFAVMISDAILCLLISLYILFLVIYMIIYLVKDWNNKIVKETMSYLISNAAGEVLGPRPGKAACSFGQGICEMILRIGVAILGIVSIVTGTITIILAQKLNISGSLSIIVGVLVIIWALIMIILRILNIGALNIGSKYFLSIDIVTNSIILLVALTVGIISVVSAVLAVNYDFVFAFMIINSVLCLLISLHLVVMVIYMIIYLTKDWNDKIVKYTIKEAITG